MKKTITGHHCNNCGRDFEVRELPPPGSSIQPPTPLNESFTLSQCPVCGSRNMRTVPMEVEDGK